MSLTQEEVLAQLRTRGFEDGFQRTPLRRFKGKLDSITGNMTNQTPPRLEVLYNFSEVEVIESTEPYTSPIAQISIMQSIKEESGMGVLGCSIDNLLNLDEAGEPLPALVDSMPNPDLRKQEYLIGKMQEWAMTPGHMMWDGVKGSKDKKARDCWEVVEVEGEAAPEPVKPAAKSPAKVGGKAAPKASVAKGAKSAQQTALELLNGKTLQQFNNEVFKNPICKADAALVNSLISNTFIPPLEEAGLVAKDDAGIYTVTLPS